MEPLELSVIRKWKKSTYTIGKLRIDGKFFADTLEDVIRDLKDYNHDGDYDDQGEGKIYGETAIPCGRYEVVVTESPKMKRRLPLLLDVPGFIGIRIHAVATAKGTEGCIGIGRNMKPGRLENGPYYETLLVQMIDEAKKEGKSCFITIKE